MESSIYADLKKFAGKIEAKKVSLMVSDDSTDTGDIAETIKVEKTLKGKPRRDNNDIIKAPPCELTIEAIAAMIPAPLTPLKDASGFVHDMSTIAARCSRGHIHKYFIRDISCGGTELKCQTCGSGNKFMTMVREYVETVFDTPFVLAEKRFDNDNSLEYVNPPLRLIFACSRITGNDSAMRAMVDNSEYILVKLHPTTSLKKIKDSIVKHLGQFPDLPIQIREKLIPLEEETKPKARPAPKKFTKEPLPFTPEMAARLITETQANPIVAQMQMNIVSMQTTDGAKLCLENC